jgi:DNA-directed RNA polymerase specialized sigma24 family protein
MSSAGGDDGATSLQHDEAKTTTKTPQWRVGRARRHRRDNGRLTDREIVARLREVEFDSNSPLWRELAGALVEYGYTVLVGWGIAGQLGEMVMRHGGRGRDRVPQSLRLDPDDIRELAAEVLIQAIEPFRSKSLLVWEPDGRASLGTFFVGRCLLEFPDVYEKWLRQQPNVTHPEPVPFDDGRSSRRPDEEVEDRVILDQMLDRDPVVRFILVMQTAGYTMDEIAERLAISTSAAKTRVFRFRRRIAREGFDA